MRSDSTCTALAGHRLVIRVVWCDGCSRWHFKHSLQRRLEPSSGRWSNIDEWETDHSLEADNLAMRPLPALRTYLLELQRLYVEEAQGVQRLPLSSGEG